MNKYVAEFIGTFFLVLTIGLTVIEPGAGTAFAPLAIVSVLIAMIYAGFHVSGAHYNPAVTLTVWLRGKIPSSHVPGYIFAHLAASVAAAILTIYFKGSGTAKVSTPAVLHVLIAEFVFTFALCYVVLHVATSRSAAGNSYYGVAIGLTVLAGIYAVGEISGGVFNPAVALGMSILNVLDFNDIWVFLVANFAGGAAAELVFTLLNPEDRISIKEGR